VRFFGFTVLAEKKTQKNKRSKDRLKKGSYFFNFFRACKKHCLNLFETWGFHRFVFHFFQKESMCSTIFYKFAVSEIGIPFFSRISISALTE